MLLMNSHEEAGSHAEVQQSAGKDREQNKKNGLHIGPLKNVKLFPAQKFKVLVVRWILRTQHWIDN